MKRISIVIVTYNSAKDIRGCLSSINENNDIGDSLEIIVVDNNSSDISELRSIIKQDYPQVILIENDKNGGYGQGNNVGINASTSPIIMIMNPDVRLFKPIFNDVITHFENNSISMLGITQYEDIEKRGNSFHPLGHSIFSLFLYTYYKKTHGFNPKFLMISGACFFIRKSSFQEIGLFDENIFMYGEEYDINKRLRAASLKIVFDGSLGYIHPVHHRVYNFRTEECAFNSLIYTRNKHGINIRKELIHTIIYLYLMKIRCVLRRDGPHKAFYSNSISFYKSKIQDF